MPNNKSKRGVVILFAVLLVSVVLTISLGVFNITYRQLVLSSIARESEVAFSVADSARNCAVYWDSAERGEEIPPKPRPFGYYETLPDGSGGFTTSLQPVSPTDRQLSNMCANIVETEVIQKDKSINSIEYRTSTFQLKFKIQDPNGNRDVCANVVVAKSLIDPAVQRHTVITVDGYNLAAAVEDDETGCAPVNHPRAVQRTIQTVHPG